MKYDVFRFMLNIILVLMCLFYSFRFAKAENTMEYLGEFCWEIRRQGDLDEEKDILQLGVLSYGAGHFILNGKTSYYSDFYFYEIVHGNAELINNRKRMEGQTFIFQLLISKA